jgi:hypothetical protein
LLGLISKETVAHIIVEERKAGLCEDYEKEVNVLPKSWSRCGHHVQNGLLIQGARHGHQQVWVLSIAANYLQTNFKFNILLQFFTVLSIMPKYRVHLLQ